ncbi:MAG: hypothetical protein LBT46_10385 [Planctomycetaceae bacterium]|jgi:hypothetical protein|nr:hypothetical protein [Planctomycetaceae bacterium]
MKKAQGTMILLRAVVSVHCAVLLVHCIGCGTTKWSDTSRTATEQLLISDAIDRAVDRVDFAPLCRRKCFVKTDAINQTTDHDYLAMTVRQQIAAAGAALSVNEENADFIVEVRSGAVGTDRDEFLVGIPALTLPAIPGTTISGAVIPEIPVIKRTRQQGIAKLALFAYNKHTGQSIWSSGNNRGESSAKNVWVGGLGPWTTGTIRRETTFAGQPVPALFGEYGNTGSSWITTPQVFHDSAPQMPPVLAPPPKK